MQNAGSSTDGRATKVLWRMLMTGRALHRKQTLVLPAWPLPGQAQGSGLRGPVLKVDRAGAPCRQGWRGERPLSTTGLAYRSSTMRSDRLPTSRSG